MLAACGRFEFDPIEPIGNRAFVTSSQQAPVSLGGLAGADAVCAERAREAGLEGRFVAWISTTAIAAVDRLTGARGWYRVDDVPLVDEPTDLAEGRMLIPLRVDEHGRDVGYSDVGVTTGSYYGYLNENCDDFTNPSGLASIGLSFYAGGAFMNVTHEPCSDPTRLYCFEVDRALPLAITPATGRRAFASLAFFTPSAGIAVADEICAGEAKTAALPGTFHALLGNVAPAAARFDTMAPRWVRVDGVVLAPTALDFLSGRSRAPLNVTANGTFVDRYAVTGGDPYVVASENNCDGWTNAAGTSVLGRPMATGPLAFAETTADCVTAGSVYCLQF